MPPPQATTREFMAERRKFLEAELLKAEPERMREYLELCAMLQALGGYHPDLLVNSMELAYIRMPLDAVVALLTKVGYPMLPEEIARGVCDGGWAATEKRRYWNVINAIRNQVVKHPGKLLTQDGKKGPVGLAAWEHGKEEDGK